MTRISRRRYHQQLGAGDYKIAYDRDNDTMLIANGSDPFRDSFATFDTAGTWDLIQNGGMTITTGGVLNGARYLNIAAGTTANAECIILSQNQFRIPAEVAVALSMSQRIANQDVSVELVEVTADGTVITDTGIVTAPALNDARNAAAMQWNGTTATGMLMVSRSDGASLLSVSGTALTTAATGSNPNFIPAATFKMLVGHDDITWSAAGTDALVTPTFMGRRTQALPASDREYKLRIRIKNGAVAPASNTDVRIHAVRVSDFQRLTVDFEKYAGRTDPTDALPVNIVTPATLPVSVAAAVTTNAGGVAAAGGFSTARLVSAAASINATVVKASVGRLYRITGFNASAAVRYLKLYNKATAPVPGTDTPVASFRIPASSPIAIDYGSIGLSFAAGISYVLTTGTADADTGALTAGDIEHLTFAFT